MKLFDVYGRLRSCAVGRYAIKWEAKSRSKPQYVIKRFLKPYWEIDCVCEEFRIPGTRLQCDIINFTKKICIEIDGDQHEAFNKHFHRTKGGWIRSLKRDNQKNKWAELNGLKMCRVYTSELEKISEKFFLETFDISL
jgi:hypothetical protein